MAGPIGGYQPSDADIEAALQRLLRFTARYAKLFASERDLIAHKCAVIWVESELALAEHGADPAAVIRHSRAMLAALDRWTPDMRPAKHAPEADPAGAA